ELTPKQLSMHLDRYIVGQQEAKRAVAVAIRNRYRRSLLTEEEKGEIIPKNILMIGPTGVGKTEIARRIAKLMRAPFLKVEATKFTEVGYVGRDVESMVRDLVEVGVRIVRDEKREEVREEAVSLANERLIKYLVPEMKKQQSAQNPFEMLFGQQQQQTTSVEDEQERINIRRKRSDIKSQLQAGMLEDEEVTIEVTDQQPSLYDAFQGSGMEQMGANMQDALSSLMPKKKSKRKM